LPRRSNRIAADMHNSMVVPPSVKTTKRDTNSPRRRIFGETAKGTKHRSTRSPHQNTMAGR